MGLGKTTYILSVIDKNPKKSYLYVTPFLDEIKRVKGSTNIDIYEPLQLGKGKLDNLHHLLSQGKSIATTHSLFMKTTEETNDLLRQGEYTLVLDEVLGAVDMLDKKTFKRPDLEFLLKGDFIKIENTGYISWNKDKIQDDQRYEDIMNMALRNTLVLMDEKAVLWHFPPEIFKIFHESYILTYGFNGALMKPYFELFNIDYCVKQLVIQDGEFFLTDYDPQNECRTQYKSLIHQSGLYGQSIFKS